MLTRRTVEKWIKENDKELDTSIWLKFDMVSGDCEHMLTLKCGVCIQFNERLTLLSYSTVVLFIGIVEVKDFLPYDITPKPA